MHSSRMLMLLTASSLAAGSIALQVDAQDISADAPHQAGLRRPASVASDTPYARLTPHAFGLKPPSASSKERFTLPFSLNYSSAAKSVIMPLDEHNTWGIGVMLNVNSGHGPEPTSAPGLQPKRTPGIMLQKKF